MGKQERIKEVEKKIIEYKGLRKEEEDTDKRCMCLGILDAIIKDLEQLHKELTEEHNCEHGK